MRPGLDALEESVAHAAVPVLGFGENIIYGGPRLREEGWGALAQLARDKAHRPLPRRGHEEERVATVRHVGQKAPHRLLGAGGCLVDPVVGRMLLGALHPQPRRLGRVLPAPWPDNEVLTHKAILTHAPQVTETGGGV